MLTIILCVGCWFFGAAIGAAVTAMACAAGNADREAATAARRLCDD